MPAKIIQMVAFTQIIAIWTPGFSLQDHLKKLHTVLTNHLTVININYPHSSCHWDKLVIVMAVTDCSQTCRSIERMVCNMNVFGTEWTWLQIQGSVSWQHFWVLKGQSSNLKTFRFERSKKIYLNFLHFLSIWFDLHAISVSMFKHCILLRWQS